MKVMSSWGRLSAEMHRVIELGDLSKIHDQLAAGIPGIAFGNGRSYGDACLNPNGTLWHTRGLDRFIKFDSVSGVLTCEAGVLLGDIQRMMVPRGWMLAVSPGTQMATVGGAIANDVHGKNQHGMGSFGDHVGSINLVRTSGEKISCALDKKPDWFSATVGGLGLTGVIQDAQIRLRPTSGPWMQVETLPFHGLAEFFQMSEHSVQDWEYSVSWIDCLARPDIRGLFMRAKNSLIQERPEPRRRKMGLPFEPPFSLINRFTLKALNAAYFHAGKRKPGVRLSHYQDFLYPLDHLHGWNRMYGPDGFYQYQSVVPPQTAFEATAAMLKTIAKSGEGSFLAVLKTFGQRRSLGMLGFPGPGTTLALDFPNRGGSTLRLLARLDAIVAEAGGRIYAAKDARMPRSLWESGYARVGEFMPYRDPGISSALSRRLMGI